MTPPSKAAASKSVGPIIEYESLSSTAALPRTGVLLIGTAETVRSLAAQVGELDAGVVLAGSVLVPPPLRLADCAENWTEKQHLKRLSGDLPVFGGPAELPGLHARHRFKLAIVSLPRSMSEDAGRVRESLARLKIPSRWVPTFADLIREGEEPPIATVGPDRTNPQPRVGAPTTFQAPPAIDLAALIGREPYTLDRAAVSRVLTGKRILITGAGGSIGSHLAHVVAGFNPECLILVDRSENSLFEIDRLAGRRFPEITRRAILHDVVDHDQTLRLLVEQRPQVVFHAAAHKHVPLMEDHPAHAVSNNFFGTKSIVDAALATGAERFVMISSDKAVNPTSVMGATKRLAEVYVRSAGLNSGPGGTRTSMVRFGNVLGSACSVLTIWATQIAEGGPVTITDPRMTRYFMTIPEAATLVIQSTTIGSGPSGSVYVLDMGKPIRILDLAQRFVNAHGFEARVEGQSHSGSGPAIDIVFTGARPGEKIHEELAYSAELLRSTDHPGINSWGGDHADPGRYSPSSVVRMVADLSSVRSSQDREAVLASIRRHVPEMTRTNTK